MRKYYDESPSGMQILEFRKGSPPIGSANTIHIRLKDLGWKNTARDNYNGTVDIFTLNKEHEIYDSLGKLAKAKKKGLFT